MDDGDLGREPGQEGGLLERGVTAADHHQLAAPVEETVAGGAGRDPAAEVLALAGQPEHLGLGAGGDDQGLAAVLHVLDPGPERRPGQLDLGGVGADELGTEALGLLAHLAHQLGPEDPGREAGVVLDLGGEHELAAGLRTFQDDRPEVRPGGVEGRGQPGRAGADDQHRSAGAGCGHQGARASSDVGGSGAVSGAVLSNGLSHMSIPGPDWERRHVSGAVLVRLAHDGRSDERGADLCEPSKGRDPADVLELW